MELNEQNVAALTKRAEAANAADEIHFDDGLKGFGLRLRRGANGRLRGSFIIQYRVTGGTRRIKLGDVEKLRPEKARKLATKLFGDISEGKDPSAEKTATRERAAHTMRSVAEQYLAAKQKKLRASSFHIAKLYLTGDAYFKALHAMPVSEIELRHVATCLRKIDQDVSSNTAAAARRALSAMFSWAMGEGLLGSRPVNPVAATNTPDGGSARDRVLTDAEIAAIWKACEDDQFGRIVRLLLLTGCRRDEIGALYWSEIDFETRSMSLPADRVKNHRAHTVPLSPTAFKLLDSAPRVLGREQVFGIHGTAGSGFTDYGRQKTLLDERSGVTKWRLHDLRRTAATRMADLGVPPHIIEQALNHQSGHKAGVAGIYNRSAYTNEVRDALNKWDKRLGDIVARPQRLQIVGSSKRA